MHSSSSTRLKCSFSRTTDKSMGEIVSVQKTPLGTTIQSGQDVKNSFPRTTVKESMADRRFNVDLSTDQIWQEVINQRSDQSDQFEDRSLQSLRIARFFISSTFKDFTHEREFLVKHVLTELEDVCRRFRVAFYECDLRWGIPRDFGDNRTIGVCLDTIQQCQLETGGQPFFIAFLGSRYGWVPDVSKLDATLTSKHRWIENTSITHMEIIRAALVNYNKNALFFIRNEEILGQIPEDQRNDFKENDPQVMQKLEYLKCSIYQTYPLNQIVEYSPIIVHDKGSDKFSIHGFEIIQENVVKFFNDRIQETFPLLTTPKSHDKFAYVQSLSSQFQGRKKQLDDINQFLLHNKNPFPILTTDDTKSTESSPNTKTVTSNILLIHGKAGIGKSALLSKVLTNLVENPDTYHVMYHFVSQDPDSQSQSLFLQETLCELEQFLYPDKTNANTTGYSELDCRALVSKFEDLILEASTRSKRLFLIVDGIDYMDKDEQHLQTFIAWISDCFQTSASTKLVVSCGENDLILGRLRNLSGVSVMQLEGLDVSESKLMVEKYLLNFQKRLDEQQIEILTGKRNINIPLWVELCCSELIKFGSFENLTSKLESIPDDIEQLSRNILERLLNEDESKLLSRASGYLFCCKTGLREPDLRLLMGDYVSKTPLNAKNWSMVSRQLRPFTQVVKKRTDIVFAIKHLSMQEALSHILSSDDCQQYRLDIVKYFRDFNSTRIDDRAIQIEVPHQLQQLNKLGELVAFLKTHKVGMKTFHFEKSRWLKQAVCSRVCQKNPVSETQLFVCVYCKNSMTGLGQVVRPNVQCCVICSGPTFEQFGSKDAWFCVQHRVMNAPNCSKCFVCDRQILPNMEKTALKKCMSCNMMPNQCSHLPNKRS